MDRHAEVWIVRQMDGLMRRIYWQTDRQYTDKNTDRQHTYGQTNRQTYEHTRDRDSMAEQGTLTEGKGSLQFNSSLR
jgi:hypothetical protein